MTLPLVEVRDLVRTFRIRPRRAGIGGALLDLVSGRTETVRAVDGISFEIHPGEVVGYIGPNGAGKSTTVKCLTGILKPDSGLVRVAGLDPWKDRRKHVPNVGVVFGQRTQLWWDLAVQEAFDLLASVFRVPDAVYAERMGELNELLEIEPLLRVPVRELSLGQRVRCDFAAALLHGPQLLVLDEPTIGLDVAVKLRIRRFIRHLVEERGMACLLTTHDLGDVAEVCDRVLLIDGGRLVYEGGMQGLRQKVDISREVVVRTRDELTPETIQDVGEHLNARVTQIDETSLRVRVKQGAGMPAVVAVLMARLEVEDLAIHEPSLEEVVAGLYTGEKL